MTEDRTAKPLPNRSASSAAVGEGRDILAALSLAELLARALEEAKADVEGESQLLADLLTELARRRSDETFQRAAELTRSSDPTERSFGAHLLGLLAAGPPDHSEEEGIEPSEPVDAEEEPDFLDEIPPLLVALLDDRDVEVVNSAILALGHFDLDEEDLLARLRPFVNSSHVALRQALAMAVAGADSAEGIDLLITLSRDADTETRDWATFGMAQLTRYDSRALRAALVDRLSDADPEVRGEALLGLAQRRDERALEPLEEALRNESLGELELEAARHLASPVLLPALLDLRDWWDASDPLLEEAIAACRITASS